MTCTMEIYLDANATTPVLPEARAAALAAMSADYGNPSSTHSAGLKARALVDETRACARRVLGAPTGELLFLSGATEGIQMAVLSALTALRQRRERGESIPQLLLFGATEHKAVPEALRHWNLLLSLNLQVLSIPVGADGRHDLGWLRQHAPRAGLVCTMAANNETGVVSDLAGIQAALEASPALWMVDSVQALGKLPLSLGQRPIDYAPFSGHKLYAPKGVGLLYVREGAPITPLITGGGQEGALRSGTENMPGIAALGAVLKLLEAGNLFKAAGVLASHRERLTVALRDAFPKIVFNADPALSLPTTLNFSVPGVSSQVLLNLFDAAQIRVSSGSACGAARAQPSHVLEAMGLPAWRCASAVRLSFGPATPSGLIDEACERIRECGASLRDNCLVPSIQRPTAAVERINRHAVGGLVCYLVADPSSRRCVIIDPLPDQVEPLAQWVRCRNYVLAAVLQTSSHRSVVSCAAALWKSIPAVLADTAEVDSLGWPRGAAEIALGGQRLTRLHSPGSSRDATAYLLHDAQGPCAVFVGDALTPRVRGGDVDPGDSPQRAALLRQLQAAVGDGTLLLSRHDPDDLYASTLNHEMAQLMSPAPVAEPAALSPGELLARIARGDKIVLVDVREPYEYRLGSAPQPGLAVAREAVPVSSILNAIPHWRAGDPDTTRVLFCRSGSRSAQAARALRRLGLERTASLAGGIALWPDAGHAARRIDRA